MLLNPAGEFYTHALITKDPKIDLMPTVRELFLSAVKAHYWRLIEEGFVMQGGAVGTVLLHSVDIATERVLEKGQKLCDWYVLEEMTNPDKNKLRFKLLGILQGWLLFLRVPQEYAIYFINQVTFTVSMAGRVYMCSANLAAHRVAQKEVARALGLTEAVDTEEELKVIAESENLTALAEERLQELMKTHDDTVCRVQTWQCIRMIKAHLHHNVNKSTKRGIVRGKTREELLDCIGVEGGH